MDILISLRSSDGINWSSSTVNAQIRIVIQLIENTFEVPIVNEEVS